MSQAKVDRYKEEKKNRKKSWQKKKESVSLFFTICRAIWLMQSSAPESRFVT